VPGGDLRRYWRLAVGFSALGFLVACTEASYLYISYPERNPRILRVLDFLCPPSTLDAWFIDAPHASIGEQCVLWVFIALINAGLYGAVGVFFVKLGQFMHRKNPSRS
jgi:hypothetical protein